MGRRKIEIKAIKDDRNRSVTFLKRKGGLFKKAHELSVLCSVDVAVIIFGHNKKLYEYSSGNINETIQRFNYYGEAHEHKGPGDFAGKGNLDDDDDEEGDDATQEEQMPAEHNVPSHLQNQSYRHMSQGPSASPPMANGVIPFHNRQHTPQPQMGSRPSSRNTIRRPSSNLAPHHAQQQHVSLPPTAPNGFAYVQHTSMYNPQGMQAGQHPSQQQAAQYSQYQYPQQPAPAAQMQQPTQMSQSYMQQDQRRQSMPPAFPQHDRAQQPQPLQQLSQTQHQQSQHQQTPPQRHTPSPPQPGTQQRPHELKPVPTKNSRSIFTPIDDRRSLLAQTWGIGTTTSDNRADIKPEKDHQRSQSIDVGNIQRGTAQQPPAPGPPRVSSIPHRGQSISSLAGDSSGAKRPRLKVQIPSEQSDDGGSPTAGSSPRGSNATTADTPAKTSAEATHSSSGVVLPPPSPSASALLSAGAQGPPNPFARPHPPMNSATQNNQAYNSNNNIETPISALPSRFVADGLLPSPSSFYPEWGFGRAGGESNMLPSPLNFQTPVVSNGPSFLRDEDGERKRKSPEGDGSGVAGAGQEAGGGKRVKV